MVSMHHAHDDQQRRCADRQVEWRVQDEPAEERQQGDHAQEQRAGQRDAVEHAVQVIRRVLAGPVAGDEAAVLLQVLGSRCCWNWIAV